MAKESKECQAVKAVKMPKIAAANLVRSGTSAPLYPTPNLPVSDHSPVVSDTDIGVIVSSNMWCPGSPIAPSKNPNDPADATGNAKLVGKFVLDDNNHQEQMEKTAQYYFAMAKAGAVAFMLQEVPQLGVGLSYADLNNEINKLCVAHSNDPGNSANPITLEFKIYKKTDSSQGGTCALVNTAVVDVEEIKTNPPSSMDRHHGCYKLTKKGPPKVERTIYNVHAHGDPAPANQTATKTFIEQTIAAGHMVCGDFNLLDGYKPVIDPKYSKVEEKCGNTWDGFYGFTPFKGLGKKADKAPVVAPEKESVSAFEKNKKAAVKYLEDEDYEVKEASGHRLEVSKDEALLFSMTPKGVIFEEEGNDADSYEAAIRVAVKLFPGQKLDLKGFPPEEEKKIKACLKKMPADIQEKFKADAPVPGPEKIVPSWPPFVPPMGT